MSARPHPTISAWQRDPVTGAYQADLHDWKLRVTWKARPLARGEFRWEAERAGERTRRGDEPFEEMEEAMAEAEHFAAGDAARRTAEIASRVAESGHVSPPSGDEH
jgi:hypothetical protein